MWAEHSHQPQRLKRRFDQEDNANDLGRERRIIEVVILVGSKGTAKKPRLYSQIVSRCFLRERDAFVDVGRHVGVCPQEHGNICCKGVFSRPRNK